MLEEPLGVSSPSATKLLPHPSPAIACMIHLATEPRNARAVRQGATGGGLEFYAKPVGLKAQGPFKERKWVALLSLQRPQECGIDELSRESACVNHCHHFIHKFKLVGLASFQALGQPVLHRHH